MNTSTIQWVRDRIETYSSLLKGRKPGERINTIALEELYVVLNKLQSDELAPLAAQAVSEGDKQEQAKRYAKDNYETFWDVSNLAALEKAWLAGYNATAPAQAVEDGERVKKVCYCGSLRVALEAFKKAEYEAVLKGEIALLPCCMFVDIEREYGAESDYKQKADDLHKRKIDISDEVFVLNVDGYIGKSTRSEIEYALSIGKPVKYLVE